MRWPALRRLALAAGLLGAAALPARAQDLPEEPPAAERPVEPTVDPAEREPEVVEPPAPTGPSPMSVTISGGGTKGAYMAGQLYYLQHLLRLGSGDNEIRAYTGASAGAINSITSLLAQCGAGARDPRQSVYWSVWIPVGLNELFDPDATDETSLFTRRGFAPAIDLLRKHWTAGLPESCDLLMGIAVTRLNARTVALAPGFPSLPRSLETVLLRVTGRGLGREPLLRNYVDPAAGVPQVILPLDGKDAQPFDSLRDLVFASSAFPVGFEPVDLAHCISEPGKPPSCTPSEAAVEQFIDGGVFDNQPLGLSVRAMRGISRGPDGSLRIGDHLADNYLPNSRFIYIDPRVSNLPQGVVERGERRAKGAVDVIAKMLSMVESAQSAELLNVFEREPELRRRLVMTDRHFPHVSSTFSGLLDRAFREFDFYLGMYDAARGARQSGLSKRYPEEVYLAEADAETRRGWKPFLCLRAIYDGSGDAQQSCGGDELKDFRILARVTLDRLRDLCRNAEPGHPSCRASLLDRRIEGVTAVPEEARTRRDAEGDIDFLLRMLGAYRFHFRDLGLDRDDAQDVRFHLARVAQEMVVHLASVQPADSVPLGMLGRVGVDLGVGYVPPQHIFHLSLGLGAEFGYSLGIDHPDWSWLRFTTALELDGFSSLLNTDDNYLAVRPKLGLEFEVLSGSYAQLRLGARGGYQFSTGDGFARDDCDFSREDVIPCSRLMTEAYVASTLVGLIRVHVAGVYMPPLRDGQDALFGVRPMVGIQVNSPF